MSRKAVVLDSPVRLAARLERPRSPWEIGIRYAAAYACTLIAVAASQLAVRTDIVLLLAALTLAGLPLSLGLRRARRLGLLRLGGRVVPRPLINGGVMAATLIVSALLLAPSLPPDLSRLFDISFATQTVKLLMQGFLIFGVCRCLAILNDKDAVLCTVPSFSVLLLLIVIDKTPTVVAFFALWAIASAVLLSLDFRSDIRAACSATVPGLAPNQELKLSGRALAIVLGFSLSGAGVLSYSLSGDEGARAEDNWVSTLASRINSFAMDLPEASGSSGPERQIDFASLPPSPMRTRLWSVKTVRSDSWAPVRPSYWRLFTLSQYDGHTWSQSNGSGALIDIVPLDTDRWPLNPLSRPYARLRRLPPGFPRVPPQGLQPAPRHAFDVQRFGPPSARARYFGASALATSTWGASASASASAGKPAASRAAASGSSEPALASALQPVGLRQYVKALSSNTGFVPILPGVTALRFQSTTGAQVPIAVRERSDASVDVGVLLRETATWVQSDVAPLPEFGLSAPDGSAGPPARRIVRPGLVLSEAEQRRYLDLPPSLPARVREWALARLRGASRDESNFRRAMRLSSALQEGAFYTLRPPLLPADRDATDFFLFDSRRGYCTHFAGSLAATCRAVGIPSRIVSGFTNAEWPAGYPGTAELRDSGSHAWVEVWEPGWGWALVDPTPPESRGNNAPSLLQSWEDLRGIVGEFLVRRFAPLSLLAPGLAWALALLGLALAQRARRARVLRPQGPDAAWREDALARAEVSALFERAARRMSRRFRPRAPWETPGEWLEASREALGLREEAPLQALFELYALARFSPRPLDVSHIEQARAALARLRWKRKPPPKKALAKVPEQAPST